MKELNLNQLEKLNGGEPNWTHCAGFALGILSMATGPWGILGLASAALAAGDCEAFLGL